jgi:hypothetical protein
VHSTNIALIIKDFNLRVKWTLYLNMSFPPIRYFFEFFFWRFCAFN